MLYYTMKYIHPTAYSTEVKMNNPELHVSKGQKTKFQEENTVGYHFYKF